MTTKLEILVESFQSLAVGPSPATSYDSLSSLTSRINDFYDTLPSDKLKNRKRTAASPDSDDSEEEIETSEQQIYKRCRRVLLDDLYLFPEDLMMTSAFYYPSSQPSPAFHLPNCNHDKEYLTSTSSSSDEMYFESIFQLEE